MYFADAQSSCFSLLKISFLSDRARNADHFSNGHQLQIVKILPSTLVPLPYPPPDLRRLFSAILEEVNYRITTIGEYTFRG